MESPRCYRDLVCLFNDADDRPSHSKNAAQMRKLRSEFRKGEVGRFELREEHLADCHCLAYLRQLYGWLEPLSQVEPTTFHTSLSRRQLQPDGMVMEHRYSQHVPAVDIEGVAEAASSWIARSYEYSISMMMVK